MSSASDHSNKRTLSSQKSDDNGSSRKRRLVDALDGTRPARSQQDSRWQPADEHLEIPPKTLAKRSRKETAVSVDQKMKDLTDWVAGRLQDHSWNSSNREVFRGKLTTYQSVQINGHEKNLADVLVRDVGPAARQKLPDETKKDLVVAVQEFLKDNEDVLRYFRSSRKAS